MKKKKINPEEELAIQFVKNAFVQIKKNKNLIITGVEIKYKEIK